MQALTQSIGILARYAPATGTKSSGVILTLPRWKKSKRIPYDHARRDAEEVAQAWLAEKGIRPSTFISNEPGYAYAVPWAQLPRVLQAFGLPVL